MRAAWCRYKLDFRFEAKTSRETLTHKTIWLLKIWDEANPSVYGLGECAHFPGLSKEPTEDVELRLNELCLAIKSGVHHDLSGWSSLRMAYETALADLENGGHRIIYPSEWTAGRDSIAINGLVWMGSADLMLRRIKEKLDGGFRCLKMKIGGVDFADELKLLSFIRREFSPTYLTLRLDANGAFTPENAMERLKRLAEFHIHSIEQPIRAGQTEEMARLCEQSPIDIALDEELIGIETISERNRLLSDIRPQYIILKPTLCGGLSGTMKWVSAANAREVGWWITSALESNIGLNAIAQLTAHLGVTMPQGLGTGALYSNNIQSPLLLAGDELRYNPSCQWTLPQFQWIEP